MRGTYRQHLSPLKLVQKKLIRIITSSEYLAHTSLLFKETNILKLDDLHNFILAQYMYKLKQSDPDVFDRQHSYYTRHRNVAHVSITGLPRLSALCHLHVWNELPLDVKESVNLQQFKRRVKTHYVNRYV